MPISLDLMPLEEKPPEAPQPKTIVVRYGYLKEIGEFPSDITSKVGCGTKLIVRSERGTEIAEMLTTVCGNGGCNKSITRDKMLEYIEKSGARDYPFSEAGRIIRVATAQDLAEQSRLDEQKHKHLMLSRELVTRHNLPMKMVEVEHLLGGERVLFYFVSEQRIDFRSLVRDLAHALHTRIELRQVGSRDEARLTADYEKCGQHCCCKQFLKVLTPISMRSAKVQKATLDPTKISGRCGRLMCCLRYEDQTYEELRKKLPKRNTRVQTEKGDAWVIDGQILTQLVLLQFDDGKREALPMEKITAFDRPKPVMSDGRIMQTPNDRPPMMEGPPGGGGRPMRGGPGAPPPSQRRDRPAPGAPVQPPAGDPLALQGPTGGDLNAGDDLDNLIADAMDDMPPVPQDRGSNRTDAGLVAGSAPNEPGSASPEPAQQRPPMPRPQNAPRGMSNRPPQGGGPRANYPQQKGGHFAPRGGAPRPAQQGNRGPGSPQGFRPPQSRPSGPANPNDPAGGANTPPPNETSSGNAAGSEMKSPPPQARPPEQRPSVAPPASEPPASDHSASPPQNDAPPA